MKTHLRSGNRGWTACGCGGVMKLTKDLDDVTCLRCLATRRYKVRRSFKDRAAIATLEHRSKDHPDFSLVMKSAALALRSILELQESGECLS